MSTQATPLAPSAPIQPVPAAPPVAAPDINTPAPIIQQAPRNELGQFTAPAPVVAPPVPVAAPSLNPNEPTSPYVLTTLDDGKVEIKYATGETFKGTQPEVLDKIARAHISTKQWAAQQRQPEAQPQVQAPQSPFATPEEKAAADYVAGLFAKQLGFGTAEEMQSAFQSMHQASGQFQQKSLAADFFSAEPSFNDTPDNSSKLTEVFAQAYPNETPTLAKLRMAHAYCLQNKIYEARQQAATSAPAAIAPIVTGGSNVSQTAEVPNINWPADKIAEWMRNNPQR